MSVGIRVASTALGLMKKVSPAMTFDLIRKQLQKSIPLVRHLGIDLARLESGRAMAALPERDELKNHIGSQHAGALFTVGETASGGALAGLMGEQILSLRPVAKGASIQYRKVARGPIEAHAEVEGDPQAILAELEKQGKVVFAIGVRMTDAQGEEVATMQVDWHVSAKR